MTISFEEALAKQSELQKMYRGGGSLEGVIAPNIFGAEAAVQVLALTDELHEVLRETPWKPWKKQQDLDLARYREELVDAFHFFMNLMLLGKMSVDDLLRMYEEKHDVNVERHETGY